MKSLSRENQADTIEAFDSTSRHLDHLLNIDNIYFDQTVDRIYPTELLTAKHLSLAIVILNFLRPFRNFIVDTVPW